VVLWLSAWFSAEPAFAVVEEERALVKTDSAAPWARLLTGNKTAVATTDPSTLRSFTLTPLSTHKSLVPRGPLVNLEKCQRCMIYAKARRTMVFQHTTPR
jgi:hypothetical protein